ncbi:MAG: twin-arginine translocase TatA/TatE family subunit [Nitrosopumilus sp. B06]|nr:MAG: twin-arginine translocase TatA/TatE family subunit [Nitrosopumilus sp. B06]
MRCFAWQAWASRRLPYALEKNSSHRTVITFNFKPLQYTDVYELNVAGSEWVIIIFVALVLILGTGRLPGAARKLGEVVNSYNKARDEIQESLNAESSAITGPVKTEREKLETIAKTSGIKSEGMTDEELRKAISERFAKRDKSADGLKQ